MAGPSASPMSAKGVPRTARARGEVIVCGGVFNSPQLLQLSGLGPGDLLRKLGIPVIRDMPGVGADLQDHFGVRFHFRCTKPITMNDIANSLWRRVRGRRAIRAVPRGPLASSGIAAGGYVRSDSRLERPDIQLYLLRFQLLPDATAGAPSASVLRLQRQHRAYASRGTRHRPRARAPTRLAPPAIRLQFPAHGG